MFKRELVLPQSIQQFDDLDDLDQSLTEYVEYHKEMLRVYGDRLGDLLRVEGASKTSQQKQQGSHAKELDASVLKNRTRPQDERGEWESFKLEEHVLRIANTSAIAPTRAEILALFKVVEDLKNRVTIIERVRDIVNDLPSHGYEQHQRFLVLFSYGLPSRIIPTNEANSDHERFKYAERFEIASMQEV